MSRYSFVEAILPEYAEGGGESAFKVFALFVSIILGGWAGHFSHLPSGLGLA